MMSCSSRRRRRYPALVATALAVAAVSTVGSAQVSNVRGSPRDSMSGPVASVDRSSLATLVRDTQREFEEYRRGNLPGTDLKRGSGGSCDEQVGRFCYWYDESEGPAPKELPRVTERRERLIAMLDSAGRASPADRWITGQRVRYLTEANRMKEALTVARACVTLNGWWCPALIGFAEHMAGNFVAAESSYAAAFADMPVRERCVFRDMTLLLDDAQLRAYRTVDCEKRHDVEAKLWFLARPFWSTQGNDARTEYYARVTYAKLLEESTSAHEQGFDKDEEELLLRYSWPRAWSRSGGGLGSIISGQTYGIVGHEPMPALPYVPSSLIIDNPTASDSSQWTKGVPPIRGRYAPSYATPLRRLEHQAAVFRRGDSALVAMAYDVSRDSAFADDGAGALVLTLGDSASTTIVRHAGPKAVLSSKARWGPVLMSAEVLSKKHQAGARARYAVRPPYNVGARVQLSDILLFAPYGEIPQSLEDALPHALASLRLRADQKLGFFWEAYGTNPAGEKLAISLVVVRDDAPEPSRMQRLGRTLRMWKEAAPVSVSLEDMSARNATTSPRGMVVDISTLKPGRYGVQLEVEVAGQYTVRAERVITVIP
jgi:hypothetical protein